MYKYAQSLGFKIAIGTIGVVFVFTSLGLINIKEVRAAGVMVPITTSLDMNTTLINMNTNMERLKSFVLDRLANAIAKAILHQITASIINWINTGFQGSPSFLTNPSGFFLDAADQITGQFISETGILSGLCSPFSIDIRANIALSTMQTTQRRYRCTLSTVINNATNIPNNIYFNGQNINGKGRGMGGFMNGNFGAGGWTAFNTMMLEPQNDPYFAFNAAVSDINSRIGAHKAAVNFDLSLGSGFMSWKKCTPVGKGQTYYDEDSGDVETVGTYDESTGQVMGGDVAFDESNPQETCTTETPGSAVASQLNKSLGVPVDELELANDINAIINALISQMISQVIGGGLRSMSGGGSYGGTSYTSQIYQNSLSGSATSASYIYDQNGNQIVNVVQQYYDNYKTSVETLTASNNILSAANSCLTVKSTQITVLASEQVTSLTAQQQVGYMQWLQDNNLIPKDNNDHRSTTLWSGSTYTGNMDSVQFSRYVRTQYNTFLTDVPTINRYLQDTYQKQLVDIQIRTSAISVTRSQIDSQLSYLGSKETDAYDKLSATKDVSQQLDTTNPNGVSSASAAAAAANELQIGGGLNQSQTDLQNAQSLATQTNSDASTYQNYCDNIVTN